MGELRVWRRVILFTTHSPGLPASERHQPLQIVSPMILGPDQIGDSWVAISSLRIQYGTSDAPDDHHVERLVARFETPEIQYVEATRDWGVIIRGEVGVRDHGDFDDAFSGELELLVFAQ